MVCKRKYGISASHRKCGLRVEIRGIWIEAAHLFCRGIWSSDSLVLNSMCSLLHCCAYILSLPHRLSVDWTEESRGFYHFRHWKREIRMSPCQKATGRRNRELEGSGIQWIWIYLPPHTTIISVLSHTAKQFNHFLTHSPYRYALFWFLPASLPPPFSSRTGPYLSVRLFLGGAGVRKAGGDWEGQRLRIWTEYSGVDQGWSNWLHC